MVVSEGNEMDCLARAETYFSSQHLSKQTTDNKKGTLFISFCATMLRLNVRK